MVESSSTAMIIISMALVLYSVGVWSERLQGRLKPWHLAFFWLGLTSDTWGTGLMIDMAGGLTADIHGITGVMAIILMLIHVVWVTAVLVKKNTRLIHNFQRFSLAVWLIWLVPYLSPMVWSLY